MPDSLTVRSRRRLGRVGLLAAVALAPLITFPTQASAAYGDCYAQAQTPRLETYYHQAEAAAYLPCAGSGTLKLMTSSGTVLAKWDFNAWNNTQLYTNWVRCTPGTVMYSWVTSHGTVQGVPWSGTTTSASITCA